MSVCCSRRTRLRFSQREARFLAAMRRAGGRSRLQTQAGNGLQPLHRPRRAESAQDSRSRAQTSSEDTPKCEARPELGRRPADRVRERREPVPVVRKWRPRDLGGGRRLGARKAARRRSRRRRGGRRASPMARGRCERGPFARGGVSAAVPTRSTWPIQPPAW